MLLLVVFTVLSILIESGFNFSKLQINQAALFVNNQLLCYITQQSLMFINAVHVLRLVIFEKNITVSFKNKQRQSKRKQMMEAI